MIKIRKFCLSWGDHRESESLRWRLGEWAEPDDGACVQDVNVLAEQLYILNSASSQQSSQENSKQSHSLLQHIQVASNVQLHSHRLGCPVDLD